MSRSDIYTVVSFVIFAIVVFFFVFLIKRAQPEKRTHWFVGCSIATLILLGILKGPIAIGASLAILALTRKEEDNPISDVGSGFLNILTLGFGIALYGVLGVLSVGGIYWFWLAIQLKSFGMFLIGVFPIAWIVTAPVGAYSWVFGTPQWVLNTFG